MLLDRNKPIYQQLVEDVCYKILAGAYVPGEKLPSVRELAARLEISNNTVLTAYKVLQDMGVVQSEAGSGQFIAARAADKVRGYWRKELLGEELPQIFRKVRNSGMDWQEVSAAWDEYAGKERDGAS